MVDVFGSLEIFFCKSAGSVEGATPTTCPCLLVIIEVKRIVSKKRFSRELLNSIKRKILTKKTGSIYFFFLRNIRVIEVPIRYAAKEILEAVKLSRSIPPILNKPVSNFIHIFLITTVRLIKTGMTITKYAAKS